MSGWTDWEQPWTRATGPLLDYRPMTGPPVPGMTVAIRSRAKPYVPTFAPWWHDLIVEMVDTERVAFSNAPNLIANFDDYPLSTHWAFRPADIEDDTDG